MRLFKALLVMLFASLVAACGGGGGAAGTPINGGSSSTLLTVFAPSPLTLGAPTSTPLPVVYPVSGGVAPYVASSSDARIVTASVSGNSLTLTPLKAGTASVVVYDAKNATVTIPVTVDDGAGSSSSSVLTVNAPSAITLGVGGSAASYVIMGGTSPYSAVAGDSRIVAATVSSSILTVTPLKAGTTSVSVFDAAGKTVAINFTVDAGTSIPLSINAPSAVSLGAGTGIATYTIVGGVPPYSTASSDARIASPSVSGYMLNVNPVKAGTATVVVYDSAGKSASMSVTVDGSSGGTSGTTVSTIDIMPAASSLATASASSVGLLVTVKDASNTTVPGQTVTFSATSGSLTGANPAPVTGVTGAVTAVTLSPGADQSNRNITVTASAGGVSKTVTIPVVGTSLVISGAGSTLAGTKTLTYTVKATDSAGKPISGATIKVTSDSAVGNSLSKSTLTTDSTGADSFVYTPTNSGPDTLSVSGLGTASTMQVVVSNEDFQFTSPSPSSNIPVSTDSTLTVQYKQGGLGKAGQAVTFTTTRGLIVGSSGVTDANGFATVVVRSSSAGPATVSAQVGSTPATLGVNFVATTPSTIVLQANPSTILPNTGGSTLNQTTLSAQVKDAFGNPVSGKTVNFTAVTDGSNGSINPGSSVTDANGLAVAQFIPGALSTPANGVVLKALVNGTSVSSTSTLTVSGAALFITIGVGNKLNVLDTVTYSQPFSVYVTDATGAPVAGKSVNLSVIPTWFGYGSLTTTWLYSLYYDPTINGTVSWQYARSGYQRCGNEDLNGNGVLDSGEDTNGNGMLEAGMPVVMVPATVTTDSAGYATFQMNYAKNYAWWVGTKLTARATVSGTESSKTVYFDLPMLSNDTLDASSTPANATSPYGIAAPAGSRCNLILQ